MKVCAEPGCPEIQPESRCLAHRRQGERRRGTRQQRGYGAEHDRLGRDYQRRMDAGETFACWRCGKSLGTRRGIDWDLGHDDVDRTRYRGPECVKCNRGTATRR